MSLFDLTAASRIVTGGNGGIGLGMARAWRTGAAIAVAGANMKKIRGRGSRARQARHQGAVLEVDVASEASCAR